ncbi:MAG: acetate kinase [Candidatus Omnitrophica bacterium]|nr:acetate kinase [Candidatus Omnitrophota bacterium]
MKILVINTGSSSIKYELFDMTDEYVMASGNVERIAEAQSFLTHQYFPEPEKVVEKKESVFFKNHEAAFECIAELLKDKKVGPIKNAADITAVGHRVVHGGERFKAPVLINESVVTAIREHIPLAPLHNPANLKGIEIAGNILPNAYQIAVFDTAFHQSMPRKAFLYALPLELYKKYKVRRYGFHGTSHAFVAEQAAQYLGKPLKELNLITIHLGNGCSMAAIQQGRCVDTSMGMTPLEGLVMGTRSGDIDPAIPLYLADYLNLSLKDIDRLLNKESGLKGLCGENDLREIIKKYESSDESAQLALEVYTYRIKKYIGAYLAVLGRCHGIVFTAGIGENSVLIREMALSGLEPLGIILDDKRNHSFVRDAREISLEESLIKVMVIPTNEELEIARATLEVVLQHQS